MHAKYAGSRQSLAVITTLACTSIASCATYASLQGMQLL